MKEPDSISEDSKTLLKESLKMSLTREKLLIKGKIEVVKLLCTPH